MPAIESNGHGVSGDGSLASHRPEEINKEIKKLLSGPASELLTEHGRFLMMLMTPSEMESVRHMAVGDPPGLDGVTCDLCRGRFRFANCNHCHGSFDPGMRPVGDKTPSKDWANTVWFRLKLVVNALWKR